MSRFAHPSLTFFILCFLLPLTAAAAPITVSFSGELIDTSAAQLFEFEVGPSVAPVAITFETFASAGGTNAAGEVFNPPLFDVGRTGMDQISEGFEPRLFLFNAAGVEIDVFSAEGPGSKPGWDILAVPTLATGSYTLALAEPMTFSNGGLLANGFRGCVGCDFQRGPFGSNGPLWAIDFSGVEDVQALPGASTNLSRTAIPGTAAVPEPGSLALLGFGAFALLMRTHRKHC